MCRAIDKSGANKAAVVATATGLDQPIEPRQIKHLDNRVEQDHRAIKRIVRPMLGFKSFACARTVIAGIETMQMVKKGQLAQQGTAASTTYASLRRRSCS